MFFFGGGEWGWEGADDMVKVSGGRSQKGYIQLDVCSGLQRVETKSLQDKTEHLYMSLWHLYCTIMYRGGVSTRTHWNITDIKRLCHL